MFLTVGIPTARREGADYLSRVVESLFDAKGDFRVVVLDTDVESPPIPEFKQEGVTVFKTTPADYPSWPVNPKDPIDERCVGDPPERTRWRSKQAWDAALVIETCFREASSEWFMHVEDDCLARPGWYDQLTQCLTDPSVKYARFSDRGYFGHAFRKDVMLDVSDFVKQRWDTLPIDWLIDSVPLEWKQGPCLFDHIGTVSSLAGQVRQ